MRTRHYDLAIAPRWGSLETYDSLYLAYMTGAPQRCGYSASVDGGDTEVDGLLTLAVTGGSMEHESVRSLRLLRRSKILQFDWDEEAVVEHPIQALLSLAARQGRPGADEVRPEESGAMWRRYAVVSPGATSQFRAWPVEYLVEFVARCARQHGLHFCLVGGKADTELCAQIVQLLPECVTDLGGRTTISELARLIAGAVLFVGNDSGTAHIAGGLGTPTMVISSFPISCNDEHPNSPTRFRPCGPRVRVLQPAMPLPPCHPTCNATFPHCIRQISVDDMLQATSDLIRDHDLREWTHPGRTAVAAEGSLNG